MVVKNELASSGDAGDLGLISGLGRCPGKRNSNLLQYSCLKKPMDRGAWWATIHRVTKSWKQLRNWTHMQLTNKCSLVTNVYLFIYLFYFWGSKITTDGDCSHEVKRHLLLGRKAITNLDSILKSRDSTLPTKVHLVKAMVFSVVTYGCENWTIQKAERWRIVDFWLWCWKKIFRVHWIARRSNQSVLKEINPEYSLESLMLKLKRQYFGHLMWRTDSLEKTLMLGKIEGKRRRGQQRIRWLDDITNSWTWIWASSGSWW